MSLTIPDICFLRSTPLGLKNGPQLDTETKFIIMEAEKLGMTWRLIPDSDVTCLTLNGHTEYLRNGAPSTNRSPGSRICAKKHLTRAMLIDAGVPVTKGFAIHVADTQEYRRAVFTALQKPLVVKPANSTHGEGVKLNITSLEEFNDQVNYLFDNVEHTTSLGEGVVLAEEQAVGKEYRIIATHEKVLAVMHREPASVTGNGLHTVKELIDQKNKAEIRNISEDIYPHIILDDDMLSVLQEQHMDFGTVPENDKKVWLRKISNIMAGGDAYDMTDEIHPSVSEVILKTMRSLPGMTFAGIDFMTTDITADQASQQCAVIEVNSAPEYAMHDLPMYGKKRNVAIAVLELMFPELKSKQS